MSVLKKDVEVKQEAADRQKMLEVLDDLTNTVNNMTVHLSIMQDTIERLEKQVQERQAVAPELDTSKFDEATKKAADAADRFAHRVNQQGLFSFRSVVITCFISLVVFLVADAAVAKHYAYEPDDTAARILWKVSNPVQKGDPRYVDYWTDPQAFQHVVNAGWQEKKKELDAQAQAELEKANAQAAAK